MATLHKKTIIKKTIQIGSSTLISRFLGIIRELLMVRYLGAGIISDAFIVAFLIPNSLRKIFAEGALSAAFIPPFVTTLRTNEKDAASLMSLAFILFEGSLLILCAVTMMGAHHILHFFAPGFSESKIAISVTLFRILMPFILFISSSALLASALHAVGRFFVPAFGPILLNIVYICGLLICWIFKLPVTYLCFFIVFAGFLQFLHHLITYFNLGFSFGALTQKTWHSFKSILAKFMLCALSMSVMELSLIIDTRFASRLADGTPSLLYYANRFMGIPLGVFAVAFSTILLPHFARITTYAPKRLNFYVLESAKLVFWVTIPCTLFMIFFADKIFTTLFLSDSFSMQQAQQAAWILIAFVSGLFFFAFNKILLNIFYALHNTLVPSIVSVIGVLVNILFNIVFLTVLKGPGLALATTLSGIVQTILLFCLLRRLFGFHGYLSHFLNFVIRYLFQLVVFGLMFLAFYFGITYIVWYYTPPFAAQFFLMKIGLWLWVGPLCLILGLLLYYYRSLFGIRLYFLD